VEGERAGRRDLARRAGVETPTGLRSESTRSWSVEGVASRLRRADGAGEEDEVVRLSCFFACTSHGSVRGMLSGFILRSDGVFTCPSTSAFWVLSVQSSLLLIASGW